MSKTVSLDVEFDGNVERLAQSIRVGAVLRYNGRPFPIPNVIVQGNILIAVFAHRPLMIDLTDAMAKLEKCPSVRLRMSFVN